MTTIHVDDHGTNTIKVDAKNNGIWLGYEEIFFTAIAAIAYAEDLKNQLKAKNIIYNMKMNEWKKTVDIIYDKEVDKWQRIPDK